MVLLGCKQKLVLFLYIFPVCFSKLNPPKAANKHAISFPAVPGLPGKWTDAEPLPRGPASCKLTARVTDCTASVGSPFTRFTFVHSETAARHYMCADPSCGVLQKKLNKQHVC